MSGEERQVDVVVIGAGPVGENVAQYAHEGGRSVVLIEEALVGGECSYYACMPSKALLRPLQVADASAHLPGLVPASLDQVAVLERRDVWVSHYRDAGQVRWAQGAGIQVVRGRGRLSGERHVTVTGNGEPVEFEAAVAVVIATGSRAVVPESLQPLLPWTSRDATGVVEVPPRLAIVGGGAVACEAATWLAALGACVTMIVRGPRLLASSESFASDLVTEGLRTRGVSVITGAQVRDASRDDARDTGLGLVHGGPVHLVLDTGERVDADELLIATGRRPAVEDLGLETVGVEDANSTLPTWLHLIGDAGTGAPLTHMGKYEARSLGARLAGRPESRLPRETPVPQVIFTAPQVASVGHTHEAAVAALGEARVIVADVPWDSAAGASLLQDDVHGAARLVVDADSGVVLGATFVGPDVAEMLHAATIAVTAGVTVSTLRHAVPAYPTASELWLRLLESLPVELR